MLRHGDAGEIAECRIDGHEIHGALGHGDGLRHAWHDPDERRARGFLPQRKFPPVVFLAEVPAVVAPEADDRVVLVGRFFQRIEQAADVLMSVKAMAAR